MSAPRRASILNADCNYHDAHACCSSSPLKRRHVRRSDRVDHLFGAAGACCCSSSSATSSSASSSTTRMHNTNAQHKYTERIHRTLAQNACKNAPSHLPGRAVALARVPITDLRPRVTEVVDLGPECVWHRRVVPAATTQQRVSATHAERSKEDVIPARRAHAAFSAASEFRGLTGSFQPSGLGSLPLFQFNREYGASRCV